MTFTPHLGAYSAAKSGGPENGGGHILQHGAGPVRIFHIINDLSIGGTEMMLYKLLSRMDRERFDSTVISLVDRGELRNQIEALGISVHTTRMKPGLPTPASIWRLIHLVRKLKPRVIQGWMAQGSLTAQLAGVFASERASVLWNIRHSPYSLEHEKLATAAAIKLCARLSHWPAKILLNSRSGALQHEADGYRTAKTQVIPNGFDTELFAPSKEARASVRVELGVAESITLIGLVGRYHPLKDHRNFINAARLLLQDYPDVQFMLCGKRVDWTNHALCELIHELGISERVHLLGERQDMPRLTAALDIASSSSYSEGFPNVIGEAMSCAVPCVVTDVSDMPWIVGDTGRVVPARNPEALAGAWKELLALGAEGRKALGLAARSRVVEVFSLQSVVAQYESLYESVVAENTVVQPSNVAYRPFVEHNLAGKYNPGAGNNTAEAKRSASSGAR